MRRSSAERASRRCAAAASYGLAFGAALLGARDAAAEVVRYVDRDGKVHEVTVRAEAPAVEPAAAAEAVPASPSPPGSPGDGVTDEFPYAAYVREAAALYSLPVELLLAVMKVESGFNSKAVSRAGAMGLMQLMPETAAELGVRDAFDPRLNVLGGARYLRIMINAHGGSLALALAAYHAGAGAVERYAGVPPYLETRRYVVRVRELYRWYKERGVEQWRITRS
ncbi:lytic transglycosylase domain-containing protein [Sorangium sp. So ce269]